PADGLFPLDQAFFGGLVAPAFLVTIAGGTHSGLTDMDASLTPEQLACEQMLARRYVVAFIERYLAHERGFARFLVPADAAAEGTDVALAPPGGRAPARRARSGASVGKASGGGAAGSNQATATASSPGTGVAPGSSSVAANQMPTLGFSGSWKFEATCTGWPIVTATPASSS